MNVYKIWLCINGVIPCYIPALSKQKPFWGDLAWPLSFTKTAHKAVSLRFVSLIIGPHVKVVWALRRFHVSALTQRFKGRLLPSRKSITPVAGERRRWLTAETCSDAARPPLHPHPVYPLPPSWQEAKRPSAHPPIVLLCIKLFYVPAWIYCQSPLAGLQAESISCVLFWEQKAVLVKCARPADVKVWEAVGAFKKKKEEKQKISAQYFIK